jgi:hypothetical protein
MTQCLETALSANDLEWAATCWVMLQRVEQMSVDHDLASNHECMEVAYAVTENDPPSVDDAMGRADAAEWKQV